jgi:hypothetical protein
LRLRGVVWNCKHVLAGDVGGVVDDAMGVGSMNAFHMMDTTLRLPSSPTAKALAPAVMEIAAIVGLGALSGFVALILSLTLRASQTSETA